MHWDWTAMVPMCGGSMRVGHFYCDGNTTGAGKSSLDSSMLPQQVYYDFSRPSSAPLHVRRPRMRKDRSVTTEHFSNTHDKSTELFFP